jgi:hypothetical protein
MSVRVYVLLDVMERRKQQVAHYLLGRRGVLMADITEGKPNVIFVAEAASRQKLAELTMRAIAAIESMIEDFNVLPVQRISNNTIPVKRHHIHVHVTK